MNQYIVNVNGLKVRVAARTEKQAAIAARQLVVYALSLARTLPAGTHPRGGLGL